MLATQPSLNGVEVYLKLVPDGEPSGPEAAEVVLAGLAMDRLLRNLSRSFRQPWSLVNVGTLRRLL